MRKLLVAAVTAMSAFMVVPQAQAHQDRVGVFVAGAVTGAIVGHVLSHDHSRSTRVVEHHYYDKSRRGPRVVHHHYHKRPNHHVKHKHYKHGGPARYANRYR